MFSLIYGGRLTITTCWCGTKHAVPEELYEHTAEQLRNGKPQNSIYCPLGHSWIHKGESEAVKLERQLQVERQRHDQTRAELKNVGNLLNAEKSAKARIKNRIEKGICIHCNRSFVDLRRHMETKHAECKAK